MPKPDISALRPLAFVEETRTFTDPAQPGIEIPLTFRVRKDLSQEFALKAVIRDLMTDYVKGRNGGPPAPFIVHGERLAVTIELCSDAAVLSTYEVPEDGDKAYTPMDWFGFSRTMPTLMENVLNWFAELEERAQAQTKNV